MGCGGGIRDGVEGMLILVIAIVLLTMLVDLVDCVFFLKEDLLTYKNLQKYAT